MTNQDKTALLSKLRAPVADERAAFEKWARKQPDHIVKDLGRRPDSDRYGHATAEIAWSVWQARAALASAPVAGEAQPAIILKAVDEYGPQLEWTKHWVEYPIGTKFYAAPQASEAARDAAFSAGVKAAADLVKKMVDDYDADLGSTDPETGTREYPGEGATWVCEMQELEESIRALSAQPGALRTGGSDA